MTLTNRTKLSLVQFLDLQDYEHLSILLEKHLFKSRCSNITELKRSLVGIGSMSLLLNEIVTTRQALNRRVTSKTSFNERWDELVKCLFLDGYKTENNMLIAIEPNIDGIIAIEDDLTNEIKKSSLAQKNEIVKLINESAEAFKSTLPDYNGCLAKARLSVETIVRDIATEIDGVNDNWGASLGKLFRNSFFEKKEEESISSTYTFISDGSHIPLGFTDEEYARYGRNLIMSVCYYIVKKYNNSNTNTVRI